MDWRTDSGAFTGRAFRVHFRLDADLGRGICCGRVEHLRSGDAAHFASVDELLKFVEFWLSQDPFGAESRGAKPVNPPHS
jgi:hypothetical protein